MAPLSNAERQARFQKRLREKARANASADQLGQNARTAIDDALSAIWDSRRPNDASWDDFESFEAFRSYLASEWVKPGPPNNLREWLIAYTDDDGQEFDLGQEVRDKIGKALAVVDAVHMKHVDQLPKPKSTGRR